MTQAVYLGVYHRLLLYVRVRVRNVRLWLVVVVVGDEVVHSILGEEFSILLRELCRERLVVREDEGRFIILGDNICHGKCLARASHAEKCLVSQSFFEAFFKRMNSSRLVARRLKWQVEFEVSHSIRE